MDDQTATTDQAATDFKLVSPEEAESFFEELGMKNLPEDRKANILQNMLDTVMDRVFLRIEPSLTDQDVNVLEGLKDKPNGSDLAVGYLASRVPNLDVIAQEEVVKYKRELKEQINTLVDTLDKEAAKTEDSKENTPTDSTQP